jgi:hypothetical protein
LNFGVLEFLQEANHAALYTSQQVIQHVQSYDIPNRHIRGVVGDNTISMVNTLKNIANTHSGIAHGCFAHLLQRALEVALEASDLISSIVKEAHTVVCSSKTAQSVWNYWKVSQWKLITRRSLVINLFLCVKLVGIPFISCWIVF